MLICTNEGCGTKNRDEATYCTKCGHRLLSDYRVLERIGQGANGAVYTAEHRRKPGVVLALKALFKRADIASLKAEFEVLKDLRHPNLPRYYAWFEHQGYGYLVMEFVPGQNLEQLLAQRRGPLSPTLVLSYALKLCDVLTFLHTRPQRILHRDLKPANIRLTHADVVKLVDFGLLKQGTDATRQTQRGRGTLAYMPVEQHGSGTDARSDLYSLGATLYHLLTGYEPPAAADRGATTVDLLPPPCQRNPALSPHVAAVVVQAMSRYQDDRYPDVASFKAALEFADAQPFQPGTAAPLPGRSSAGAPT
ncbi:MAG: serine/threonine-protein kinase, partial [Chloroflexales bacterium]